MFDLTGLTSNLEGSSIANVIVISLLSFALSSLIGIVYEKTSNKNNRPKFFIQALILISVPVATVMQAIGDSLAHGLGLLGALAIIRFRTSLRDPRNMVFMFASIAVGVATGVYGIRIAVLGTISFCIIVVILHFSHLNKSKLIIGFLKFELENKNFDKEKTKNEIETTINELCKEFSLQNFKIQKVKRKNKPKAIFSFEYKIKVNQKEIASLLTERLSQKFNFHSINIIFKDDYEKI